MIVWQHYESLTSTLAQELCEQLRMVLAPTLAAKFKYVSHKYHPTLCLQNYYKLHRSSIFSVINYNLRLRGMFKSLFNYNQAVTSVNELKCFSWSKTDLLTTVQQLHSVDYLPLSRIFVGLRCFDDVVWVSGRASGPKNLTDEVLAWLSSGAKCK